MSTGAQAAAGGRIAAACSNQTVALLGKPIALRFVVHGVSCSKAHSLVRNYFQDVATQTCQQHGTACIFLYPGGWDCSFPIPALHSTAVAGCQTTVSGRPTASVTVYKATRGAGNQPSWHTVALRSAFPIYRPRQTLGVKLSLLKLTPCFANTRFLVANYGNPGSNKGAHIHVYESSPQVCGNPGEASPVTTVAINGVNVQVSVYCNLAVQTCTIKDGFSHGFLVVFYERGAKRTAIALDSSHVSLSDFLKIARSFTEVR